MNTFTLSNKAYDILKTIATLALPALGTLVLAIFKIWGLDMALCGMICGTLSAVETFLVTVLGISTANYKAEQEEE